MKLLIPFSQAEINQAIDEGCRQFEYEITNDCRVTTAILNEAIVELYDPSMQQFIKSIKTISEEMT
jgi:hypothetical protein